MKVVTTEEMGRIESLSTQMGVPPKELMQQAGLQIAHFVLAFIQENDLARKVYILAGKGNNGGDAFVAGTHLLQSGVEVVAIIPTAEESLSHLASEAKSHFLEIGGKVYPFSLIRSHTPDDGLILDGLFGTGFHGASKGVYQEVMLYANQAGIPIISIDIASGLGGEGIPVAASITLALEFPKVASYLGDGWDYSGIIQALPIGVPKKVEENAKAFFNVVEKDELSPLLPHIYRSRHKYERGFVAIVAGSPGMTGAAYLASLGAFRGGAGIVHLYTHKELEGAFTGLPQLIAKSIDAIEDIEKYDALVIGPGLGRDQGDLVEELLPFAKKVVLDGDALFHVAERRLSLPEGAILTPHQGELDRLLSRKFPKRTEEWFDLASSYARERRITLLAKGGPTFLFGSAPRLIPFGDPGMATAGSGDLLSGMIGALLSQGLTPHHAALLGASLHGIAGEIAAKKVTSYAMHVGDIADAIPEAFSLLLASS